MIDSAFCFDLETTGTDPKTDRPVQICIVYCCDNVNRVLVNSLVDPCMPIDPEAAAVHGISDYAVVGAPDFAMTAWTASLLAETLSPKYLIGFNSTSFDGPMLDNCLGSPVFPNQLHIDVLNVAMRFFPEAPSHKLGALYEQFMGEPLKSAHNASADVFGTLYLLRVLLTHVGMSLEEVEMDMRTPRPYDVMPIGKNKGKLISEVPVSWAKWMRSNATNMRPDLQATVDHILNS